MVEIFLDASYVIALASKTDQHHARKRHADKEWGLTDCVSFVLMRERGVQDALTTDTHFRQAGFRALLLSAGEPHTGV